MVYQAYSESTTKSGVINKKILLLKQAIADGLLEKKRLEKDIHRLKKQINIFLSRYYQEVGHALEAAHNLHPTSLSPKHLVISRSITYHTDYTVKSLYRKLVKLCHPDMGSDYLAYFSHVQSAYHKHDLKTLIILEQDIEDFIAFGEEDPFCYIQRLDQKYLDLETNIEKLEKQKEDLLVSPGYRLRHKIVSARMRGEDIIATIKMNARKKAKNNELWVN